MTPSRCREPSGTYQYPMRTWLAIAGTGIDAARLHPLRSLVTITCLVAALLPYLAGIGIARGVEDQAGLAVNFGADLYVSAERLGRPVPIAVSFADELRKIPGVDTVTPRIVGRIELGKERVAAVLVGVPIADFPKELDCVQGRLYSGGNRHELVVGTDLARKLNLRVGTAVPPFYRSRAGERISEVVGIFRSDVSMWQSRLVVTSFETAEHIFDQHGLATDLLVRCRPGYEDRVRATILRDLSRSEARIRVIGRDSVAAMLREGPRHREGVFTALFALAFAVAIMVLLVTSGVGMAERRREVGILKATGWQTDQVLLRSLAESVLLAVAGASVAIILAFVWLRGFNGYWIAGAFLPGVDSLPGFRVPFRLTPAPALIAFVIALAVVMTGSLYGTWRAAIDSPREAMR
jgi:ABC-type lipoprotein release transport system permease subunit